MGTAASGSNGADEWLELSNAGDVAVDLAGWTLWADDGSPKITLSGTIAAHGYYLLERTDDTTISDITADLIYTGALEDGAEVLVLRDSTGLERDRVDSWYAGDKPSRTSMERKSALLPGNDPTNWATNTGLVIVGADTAGAPVHGTPRYANSVQ